MSSEAAHNEIAPDSSVGGGAVAAMSHRARVEAAFKGEAVDRVPVSFWLHFPERDHTAEGLAEETVAQQRRFDLDIVKLMPTGMYPVMDYGVEVRPSDEGLGTTQYVTGPIATSADWGALPAVSPERGVLAREVEAVRLVRAALGPDTPILQTIFGPLSMAAKLVGGKLNGELLDPAALRPALDKMADDVIAFGRACLAQGADGFFFATQLANGAFDADVYEQLGVSYDLKVLDALRPRCWGIALHLHGERPLFELANRYPVDAVSWEDRDTTPSIAEALAKTRRCLLGGVGRLDPLVRGTADEVAAQVREAISHTGGRRLIVAPGCAMLTTVPEHNLRTMVDAVRQR